MKKSLESVGEGQNMENSGSLASPHIRNLESTSDKEEHEEKSFFASRSLTLDQGEFDKARRNMLKNSITRQREGNSGINNANSSSVPNLNDPDNQIELEPVEDG